MNLAAVLGYGVVANQFTLFPPALLFGLPIAFLACWTIGAPILHHLMRRRIGWIAAAAGGATVAAAMSIVRVAVGRFLGWRESLDDNRWSRIGSDGFIESLDGILTPYGWWLLARSVALFVAQGAVIALVLRAVIGPGRLPPSA